jgi:hypothetical protein
VGANEVGHLGQSKAKEIFWRYKAWGKWEELRNESSFIAIAGTHCEKTAHPHNFALNPRITARFMKLICVDPENSLKDSSGYPQRYG